MAVPMVIDAGVKWFFTSREEGDWACMLAASLSGSSTMSAFVWTNPWIGQHSLFFQWLEF